MPKSLEEQLADAIDYATPEMWSLIENPDINLKIKEGGYTPAERAAVYGRTEFLKALQEKGVDITSTSGDEGYTPLCCLIAEIFAEDYAIDQFMETICFLLSQGASLDEITRLFTDLNENETSILEKIKEEAEKCLDETEAKKDLKTEVQEVENKEAEHVVASVITSSIKCGSTSFDVEQLSNIETDLIGTITLFSF